MNILEQLAKRGLVHQSTDIDSLKEHLKTPRKIYCGFDPTAPSLTIGNLIPIIILSHFQKAGHTPIVILGGATGLIGDPSGKTVERQLLTREAIAENIEGQRRIFERLLDFNSKENRASICDNADWISKISYLEALRDIGKHFSVNEMIKRDSVRDRLTREQGISYTEFSYMLLQAWDFKHLYESHGVTVQLGGSDQWGNIVPGVDLVRRVCKQTVFGLTCPLVTKADGGKFGKTEAGSVWLTTDRTSPYALYQFFLNTADEDVVRFLKLFTFLPLEEISEAEAEHLKDSGKRQAQQLLAEASTTLIYGADAAQKAVRASQCLFTGDISTLPLSTILDILGGVPATKHALAELVQQPLAVVDLLIKTSVCNSKRQAREMLSSGAILVNGKRVRDSEVISSEKLLYGKVAAIRKGKKNWHLAIWE